MTDNLKIRLGIPLEDSSRDALLHLKLEDAKQFFLDYCNRSDIPETARSLVERLAVSFYEDRRGVISEKMGDTSYTYGGAVISDELRKQLNRYRRIKAI